MPRTGARPRRSKARVRKSEERLHWIEFEREDAIDALVGDDEKAARWIVDDLMGMRPSLLDLVRPTVARQLQQLHQGLETAILTERKNRKRGCRVVRNDHEAVGRIGNQMDGVCATGRLLINQR